MTNICVDEDFTGKIASAIKKHKTKCKVLSVRQGYKGTGSKAHRRQLWLAFENKPTFDIWLNDREVSFSGVVRTEGSKVSYFAADRTLKTPEEIGMEVANLLSIYSA